MLSSSVVHAQQTQEQLRQSLIQKVTVLIMELVGQLQEQLNDQLKMVDPDNNIDKKDNKTDYDPQQSGTYPAQFSNNVRTQTQVNTISGTNNDSLSYDIDFDLTAFGNEAYLSENASSAIDFIIHESTMGTVYDTNGTGNTGEVIFSLSSDADIENNVYRINEDTSETFRLKIDYAPFGGTPAGAGSYRVQVTGINYSTEPSGSVRTYNTSNLTRFRTDYGSVIN